MSKILLAGAIAEALDVADGVDLDGVNDFYSRSSDFTGNTDSKIFTFSSWFYAVSNTLAFYTHTESGNQSDIFIQSGTLFIRMSNAAGTQILSATAPVGTFAYNTFNSLQISLDLSDTGKRKVILNDEDITGTVTWTTYTDDTINFTAPDHRIGFFFGVSNEGRIAQVFLDYVYRDLTIAANRRLFTTISSSFGLTPASGQASLSPIMYFPMDDPTTAFVNQGTGGDLVQNGTIGRSNRGTNQYNAEASEIDGSNFLTYSDSAANGTLSFWKQLNGVTQHDFTTGAVSITNITSALGDRISDVYLSQTVETVDKFITDEGKPIYLGESGEKPSGLQPSTYFKMRADQPEVNDGSGADATPTGAPFEGVRGPSEFWARSADFASSSGFMTGGGFGATADGKQLSAVIAIKPTSNDLCYHFGCSESSVFSLVVRTTNSDCNVFANNAAGTQILSLQGTMTRVNNDWNIIFISVDLSDTAKRFMFKDALLTLAVTTYTDDEINYSDIANTAINVFNSAQAPNAGNRELGFMYLANQYIDFSLESNRLLFVSGLGFPIPLQPSIDAGLIPEGLIRMGFEDTSDLGLNSGTAGNFTISGTVIAGEDING